MTGLTIGPELTLPEDAVTETFAILAKRGKGKTSTAVVMAEEMIGAALPVVVIDPVGVWWGLRSSADGTAPGLPVVIFGGDHADVPLEETAGQLLADVVVDGRMPAVFDLSTLSKSASRRFMTDFIERLYHRNRQPLHVIVDEADAFAPQRAHADGARLLGAMEDLVRRGRARGLGVTLITQRPAVLNKDVLTQTEVLVVLGMTGPRDVAAIDEWVRLHADEDEARAVKASLPSLPVGTAWVWSPGWLDTLVQVHVRRRNTFDSSATPKVGQQRATPKRLADVDIAALGEKITATVEKVKAADPRALRIRIAQLERDLMDAAYRAEVAEALVTAESALADEDRQLIEHATMTMREFSRFYEQHTSAVEQFTTAFASVLNHRPPEGTKQGTSPDRSNSPVTARPDDRRGSRRQVTPPEERPPAGHASPAGGTLPKAQRAILTVLAQHGQRTRTQVAILAGYAHNGGGFNNALSALRTAGYIDGGRDTLNVTGPGMDALGPYEPLPTGQALIDHWRSRLGKAERSIVEQLVAVWPDALLKDDLAERTGYASNGGGFNNALSRLRSLELIDGRGELKASDALGDIP